MTIRALIAALACGAGLAAPVAAQDATTPAVPAPQAWQWHIDAHAFFGVNHQDRKFRDFTAWESQNWLMAMARRPAGRGMLTLSSMLSLEALTLEELGSPQVFQTGETFGTPPSALIDYQHPHDLFMGLGSEYRRPAGRVTLFAGLDLVGTPTLGPQAFMHRPSAQDNPQAPLSHHHLDSTHITPGVVRGGIQAGAWTADASWFHGREPDQDRLDIDVGALDSAAVRLSWRRGPWSTQLSAAALTQPELITPFDAKRLTASLAYTSTSPAPRIAWLAAFGQNREIHGNLEAYLFEATLRPSVGNTFYTRLESVAKDILDSGFHPGAFHRHRQSQVGAFTLGYIRDLLSMQAGTFGAGADVTTYSVPANLRESYGSPLSFHVFVRYRAPIASSSTGAGIHDHH
jgi:hypothetical protein